VRFALEIVSGKRVLLSSTKSIKDCALELLLRPIPYEHEFLSRSSGASDDHRGNVGVHFDEFDDPSLEGTLGYQAQP